jgi:transposase-like protein
MAFVQVQCPDCSSTDVVQYGKQANGTQRYRCNNRDCPRTIFLLQYQDKGRLPAVRQQIVDMTLNGSGVRDIVRVLRVSSATVIDVLKKKEPAVKQVNERVLHSLAPPHVDVISTLMPPSWMKCGALWGAKASSGGCGTRLIITRDRS